MRSRTRKNTNLLMGVNGRRGESQTLRVEKKKRGV